MILITCGYCGVDFPVYPSKANDGKQHLCSVECRDNSLRKGVLTPCGFCKAPVSITPCQEAKYDNHFCNTECRSKWQSLSIAKGSNPNWKGGITPESKRIRKSAEYAEWRLAVYEHDHFTCQSCGAVGGSLQAHHILSFSKNKEDRFVESNGSTLCRDCHKEFHRLYGTINFTPQDYFEWLHRSPV
jgi:hypothetical protein